jgi:hypothetical protein
VLRWDRSLNNFYWNNITAMPGVAWPGKHAIQSRQLLMAPVGVKTILVPVIDGQPLSGSEEISRFLVGSICSRSSLRDTKGDGNSSAPFLNAQHISSKKRRVLGLTSGNESRA